MQEATHKALGRAYQAILTDEAIATLKQVETNLEGVFLPSAPANPVSLMIVGRETTSWSGGFRKIHITPREDYITASMKWHCQSVGQIAGRSKFRQFYKRAEKIMEPTGGSVSWHNLFAISLKKNSPVRCEEFENITDISRKLLSAQIEILKPRAILFLSGPSYDIHIKKFFQGRITKSKIYEKRRLWGFEIDETQCFRTNHPRYPKGELARMNSLRLLLDNTNHN